VIVAAYSAIVYRLAPSQYAVVEDVEDVEDEEADENEQAQEDEAYAVLMTAVRCLETHTPQLFLGDCLRSQFILQRWL